MELKLLARQFQPEFIHVSWASQGPAARALCGDV